MLNKRRVLGHKIQIICCFLICIEIVMWRSFLSSGRKDKTGMSGKATQATREWLTNSAKTITFTICVSTRFFCSSMEGSGKSAELKL